MSIVCEEKGGEANVRKAQLDKSANLRIPRVFQTVMKTATQREIERRTGAGAYSSIGDR